MTGLSQSLADALGIETMPSADNVMSALPATIAAAIKMVLPELRDCKAIAGRFNLDDLKDQSIAAPAVLVSLIKWGQAGGRSGQTQYRAQIVAFVVTKDTMGLQRDIAAVNIAQAITALADGNTWGLAACGPAEAIGFETLVTAAARKLASSLAVVTWTQPFVLSREATSAITPQLYLGIAPEIGIGNEGDYIEIGGQP
jgi:hypothetical protein